MDFLLTSILKGLQVVRIISTAYLEEGYFPCIGDTSDTRVERIEEEQPEQEKAIFVPTKLIKGKRINVRRTGN